MDASENSTDLKRLPGAAPAGVAKKGAADVMPETWRAFRWPRWVPGKVRQEVEQFWSEKYGRNPKQWHDGTVGDPYNLHPALGDKVTVKLSLYPKRRQRTGRWVPAWNNIGRLVVRGQVFVVSTGAITVRHSTEVRA